MKIFRYFFAVFFLEIIPKFRVFKNFYDCIGRSTPKSIRQQLVFIKKKNRLIKNRFFLVNKGEIHVIVSMIRFTRSSERRVIYTCIVIYKLYIYIYIVKYTYILVIFFGLTMWHTLEPLYR